MKRPCLGPADIRNSDRIESMFLKIEESFFVLQVRDHPSYYLIVQIPISQPESGKNDYCLRNGMNINRIDSIMIILRSAILEEKILYIER